jgi:ribonuclease HI
MICYTDGACRGNGKDTAAGGFGVVVLDDNRNIVDLYSKQCEGTTNNREELKAILYVMLKYGRKEYNFTVDEFPPTVYSDSAYCVNTFNDWMFRWANNGWLKSDKKIPENLDLIQAYYDHYQKGYRIELKKVTGHSGNKWNEMADGLATGHINPELEKVKRNLEVIEL